MTDNKQTNKYVYLSQVGDYVSGDDFKNLADSIEKSVGQAVEEKWDDAFSTSGYIADCILKAPRLYNFVIETLIANSTTGGEVATSNRLVIGENGEESTFYLPDGPKNYIVKKMTGRLEYNSLDTDQYISSSKVVDGQFVVLMDYSDESNPKATLVPMRITDEGGESYWQYFFARPTEPEPVESRPIWWDTTNNVIKQYDDNNKWNTSTIKKFSLPLGIVTIRDGLIESITQNFNISGYSDQTVWINPDVEFGVPDGRDKDNAVRVLSAVTGYNSESGVKFPDVLQVDVTERPINMEKEYSPLDSISRVMLNSLCRDSRTLTISVNYPPERNEEAVLPSFAYSLDADMLTVSFNPAISNVETLYIKYYEIPYMVPLFVSETGELLDPKVTSGYTYNINLGHYIDERNVKQKCGLVGYYNLGYVAKKSLWTNEQLTITSYTSKQRSQLVDYEDVQYLIQQYLEQFMAALNTAIERAAAVLEDLDAFKDEINQTVVHLAGDETITGNKTFRGTLTTKGSSIFDGNTSFNKGVVFNDTTEFLGKATFDDTVTFKKVIMGTAYRALTADVAELYNADKEIQAGSLIQFGGANEITLATSEVNGIVSTDPAYLLNAGENNMEYPTAVALVGRVPVRVLGPVKKFDKIALSDVEGVAKVDNSCYNPIGKALEENLEEGEKLVECVVKIQL